jgi:hypothetical protein
MSCIVLLIGAGGAGLFAALHGLSAGEGYVGAGSSQRLFSDVVSTDGAQDPQPAPEIRAEHQVS